MNPDPAQDADDPLWREALAPEAPLIEAMTRRGGWDAALREAVAARTAALIDTLRERRAPSFLQAFLAEYGLSTEEGVALMCMAEAFLRVPDARTLDELIAEKVAESDWQSHSGRAASFMVNASTWGLMLTGKLLTGEQSAGLPAAMRGLLRRLGGPVVRTAMTEAMQRLGGHFVFGQTIEEALERAGRDPRRRDRRFSFDMLGEAAVTEADARTYFAAYRAAIEALAARAGPDVRLNAGISVKLSALHPRFEHTRRARDFDALLERAGALAELAAKANLNLNIDGEETERMAYALDIFAALARSPRTAGWQGLGMVVQAYTRNAGAMIDRVLALAEETGRRLMLRLVKGAYWDTEIKRAQVLGLPSYPVFTRKPFTDVSYLCAAERLLAATDRVWPQFATHNAHTMCAVLARAERLGAAPADFEFQRLHGMGEELHELIRERHGTGHRVYAPVGRHDDLLAYLVRRLLENGANSSFVHQLTDRAIPAAAVAADPFAAARKPDGPPDIPAPPDIYRPRLNSPGFDLACPADWGAIERARGPWRRRRWRAGPLLAAEGGALPARAVLNPADPADEVGAVQDTPLEAVGPAFEAARAFAPEWAGEGAARRAEALERAAELYREHFGELAALLAREAGKTMEDVVGEWREAIDFLRYYAGQARRGEQLAGRAPRGVFVCIAPWNFPLSIFTGQIAAALATGNTVLAKPAEQSTLVAHRAARLLHQAGVPAAALQLVTGDAAQGAALARDPRLDGVCFTGSLEAARSIRAAMAENAPAGARLIAETGGVNAMIVDSTALPEKSVGDVIQSAFHSAGQRCSALRVLYLQEEIADRFLTMLTGAMDLLDIGDPWLPRTDLGPVIDRRAQAAIDGYVDGRTCLHRLAAPAAGCYAAPALLPVAGIAEVDREVFGPVLHVARYRAEELDRVVDEINAAGYGLTAAVHSRLNRRTDRCVGRLAAGNLYVNRNQIGAVVESQPFGGRGLSGTGPKAGGPWYLEAFTRATAPSPPPPPADRLPAIPPEALGEALGALDAERWRARADRLARLRRAFPASKALAACDVAVRRPMPGPTGERNILQLRPAGVALCLGPGPAAALEQALAALAFGGGAVLCCPDGEPLARALDALRALEAPARRLRGFPSGEALERAGPLAVVGWDGDGETARELERALARRPGAIVRLAGGPADPLDYAAECHVCNDVTSSGGNVELMARQ